MSDYYAFSGIDDAIERTKSLLWPFNWSIWWRIAVISLFTGGFGGFNFPTSYNTDAGTPEMSQIFSGLSGLSDILLWLIAVLIIIAVIFSILSSIFQFVFVKFLSEKEFRLKNYFVENTGKGLRLFGFWAAMIIAVVAIVALFVFLAFSTAKGAGLLLFIPAICIFLLLILLVAIIALFTVDFVVPIMIKDDCGVIEGWKKCWRLLRDNLSQSFIYLIMKIIISIVVSILLIIAAVIVMILVGIPFLALALLAGIGLGISLLHITLLVLYLIIIIPLLLIISVPFNTFIRIYSLEVLGKMKTEYMMTGED